MFVLLLVAAVACFDLVCCLCMLVSLVEMIDYCVLSCLGLLFFYLFKLDT